jgi:AcrR family transcriptional regulator
MLTRRPGGRGLTGGAPRAILYLSFIKGGAMTKHTKDQRQNILDAALKVFAAHGYHRASIRRIAEAAGLNSPPLIYWYFTNKRELFQAVFVERLAPIQALERFAERMDDPPEAVLQQIGCSYLRAFENPTARRLFRVFILEAARDPQTTETAAHSGILKIKGVLRAYLVRQVELGRLRPHDPECSVRALMGAFMTYVLSRELIPPLREDLPDPEHYVAQTVSLFLDGLRTERHA